MKKQKSEPKQKGSIFWKPETIGEFCKGKFGGFVETDKGYCMKVGNVLVGIGAVISSFLKKDNLNEKLRVDKDVIAIQFIGKQKRARLFTLSVNGTPQEQDFSFKSVSGKEMMEGYNKRKRLASED